MLGKRIDRWSGSEDKEVTMFMSTEDNALA